MNSVEENRGGRRWGTKWEEETVAGGRRAAHTAARAIPAPGHLKKLCRLILKAKLTPCHLGTNDPRADLDECPICFLFYPSLNRSKCCSKGICTECFLQMKSPTSCRPTQDYCCLIWTSRFRILLDLVMSNSQSDLRFLHTLIILLIFV